MNRKMPISLAVAIILVFVAIIVLGIIYAEKGNEKMETSMPVPVQNGVKKTGDLTKDWKIYQNSDFGYEIKYPASLSLWTPTEKKFVSPPLLQRADFFADNRNVISVWVYPKDFVNIYDQSDAADHKTITVAGYQADRYDYKSDVTYYSTVTIPTDKYQFQIIYTDDLNKKYFDVFDQMLASFKTQLAANPETSSAIYTNNEFGFQITIPKEHEDYKAMVMKDPSAPDITYIHFIFKTSDPNYKNFITENYITHEKYPGYSDTFAFGIWNLNAYNQKVKDCKSNPMPDCPDDIVAKNDKYVIDESVGNGTPPKDLEDLVNSIVRSKDVAKTLDFKWL